MPRQADQVPASQRSRGLLSRRVDCRSSTEIPPARHKTGQLGLRILVDDEATASHASAWRAGDYQCADLELSVRRKGGRRTIAAYACEHLSVASLRWSDELASKPIQRGLPSPRWAPANPVSGSRHGILVLQH